MQCPHCRAENGPADEVCFQCGKPLQAVTRGSRIASRYEVLEVLGRGGMGVVYKAHDSLLDETVAIKILRRDVLDTPDAVRRFRSELKLARKVSHPNVCRIHDYGEDGGLSYISMVFVDGVDMRERLAEFPDGLPADEAYETSIRVAHGLRAIHEAGVIHRDLKTPNIMRDKSGVVRLMDFGIAKEAGGKGAGSLTATGAVVGTPEFMSPEQCRGASVDARSDIYALGVVIYELFTGQVPFRGDSVVATLFKHLQEPPPLTGPRAARLPAALVPVLRKALAKAPQERHASADELAAALEEARSAPQAEPPAQAAPTMALGRPSDRRADTRLETPLSVVLKRLSAQGSVLQEERTISEDISLRGMRVMTSMASVAVGDAVLVQEVDGDFVTRAVVRHRTERDGVVRVGLEFLERQAPGRLVQTGDWTSWVSRVGTPSPGARTPASASAAATPAPGSSGSGAGYNGRDRRGSSRISIPIDVVIERLDLGGTAVEKERTLAENVGRGGMRVLTAMTQVAAGSVMRVKEVGGDFETRAAICNSYVAPDRVRRLNIAFLDRQAPDRMVPSAGPRAGAAAKGASSGVRPGGATPAAAPPPSRPATPPPRPTASAAGAATPVPSRDFPDRRQVLDFLASFPTSTHFELLGVPRSASLDEVRQAYARQAAFYHPDQHRKPGLAEVHPHLKSISARLDEAHQVLTDPRRRAQYEEFLGPARQADAPPLVAPPATGSFAPQPFVAAGGPRLPSSKEVLAHARALIARDKYWDAIQELEAAVPRAEGRPERCALQVLLAATMMKNPKWLHQCEELLTNVTSENPKHVEAHLLLAGLYKGRGLRTRAERLYRKVLELDPENAAAAQELSALTEPPAGSAT